MCPHTGEGRTLFCVRTHTTDDVLLYELVTLTQKVYEVFAAREFTGNITRAENDRRGRPTIAAFEGEDW